MTKIFAIAWLGLTLMAASALARDLPPEMLLRERCHQGECTFTKIFTKRVIKKNTGGKLVEVKSRSVVVPAPKSDAEVQPPAPDSFGLVRVSYAYCSTEKPGLIFYDNQKFYVHVLNIGEPAAGYLIDSQIEYWAACHDKVVSVGDVMEGKLAKEAADLGYHKVPEAERAQYKFKNKKKALRFFGL
jgi:hypothetical protein